MKITPMEAYATTDGKLFHDKLEAEAHQFGIDITPEIEAHIGVEYRMSVTGYSRLNCILDWETSRKLNQLKAQNV
jgi:hypothetical protein